jgi:putative inorganic carbon (HCO3(-)) transporter
MTTLIDVPAGPLIVIGAAAAICAVGLALLRVEIALLAYVALEPFGGYLKSGSSAAVKAIGALVFVAWLLRVLSRGGRIRLGHPVVRAAVALFVVLLVSTVAHPNGGPGLQVLTRYLSYLGVLVVLIDAMHDRPRPRTVAAVYVVACAVASVFALVSFFRGSLRAGGPIGDPNDFAFFLVAAIPLALALRSDSHRRRLYDVAILVIAVTVLATFSRGALVGVAAMGGYALATRKIRIWPVIAAVASLGVVAAAVILVDPGQITTSLYAKGQVANQNVSDRLVRWKAAAHMTADNPLVGLGPAGFRENYDRYIDYQPTDPLHPLDVAHEMYLEVSAELGLPGLLAFLCVLGFGFRGAARRARARGPDARLAGGVTTAFVGTAVAALFLTEQYYLPIWLLAALGAVLDPRPSDANTAAPGEMAVVACG